MELALASTFHPPEFTHFRRNIPKPFSNRRRLTSKPTLSVTVAAQKKARIHGLSDELNSIASQNLDHAPARRRVRSAFLNLQQHLDHILFKMAPAGIRTEEWYEINSEGQEIFCKSWLPKPGVRIKGALCFCHGYGDTCTFFFEGIAKHIAASGYGVYAIDHPGFGLSEGLHGYIPSFDAVVDNAIEQFTIMKGRPEIRGLPRFIFGQSMGGAVALKALLKAPNEWDGIVLVAPMYFRGDNAPRSTPERRPEIRGLPRFIFGQSMGGAVALKALLKAPNEWDGIVLVAPMCKISEEITPPVPLQKVLIFLSKLMPQAKLVPQKDLADLAFRELRKKNMTPYNVISYSDQTRLRTAVELLNATKYIETQIEKVASPMLILHGAADRVTDPQVSRFLYDGASSNDKTLKLYEGGFHSILEGEPDEIILAVLNDIVSWLDSRTTLN